MHAPSCASSWVSPALAGPGPGGGGVGGGGGGGGATAIGGGCVATVPEAESESPPHAERRNSELADSKISVFVLDIPHLLLLALT